MPVQGCDQLLAQIFVRNLGCFGDSDYQLNLSPETLLVGPNNVGKSIMVGAYNFVRTCYLEQNFRSGNWYQAYNTTSYHWGDFPNIAHNHEIKRTIRAGLNFSGGHSGP